MREVDAQGYRSTAAIRRITARLPAVGGQWPPSAQLSGLSRSLQGRARANLSEFGNRGDVRRQPAPATSHENVGVGVDGEMRRRFR